MKELYSKIKSKAYQLWYGHPFLLREEVDIICNAREDLRFKHYTESQIQALIKLRTKEMYKKYKAKQKCTHEKWDCDTQIRIIECRECGKRAWIIDYKNLYTT